MAGRCIENAVVDVRKGRVTSVGRWAGGDAGQCVVDLGEVILLPGWINAHCHLDYTHMGGRIPPMKRFTHWIQAIVSLKGDWSYTEFAASWIEGARQLLQFGTTTVLDVEAVPELIPDLWAATPLRVVSLRELIHLKPQPTAAELVEQAVQRWGASPRMTGRVGLSPHALYTTSPELLRRAATAARSRGWPLMTHVAESEDEFVMFHDASGPLYGWLKSQRDMSDCGRGSPVQALERLGYLGPDLLAVHLNYLGPEDPAILARHGVHAVHCPGSHAYFHHRPFPCATLMEAGVNVCIGTDSMASMPRQGGRLRALDMFAEMRLMAEGCPGLAPGTLLRMATVHGARALRREGELGVLAPGAEADMMLVPYARDAAGAEEAVLAHTGPVAASMIHGQWAVAPAT